MDKEIILEDRKSVTSEASSSRTGEVVVGTTQIYENGRLRLIPMPSPDPKDPLNLVPWRKYMALSVICFFGAVALSAEVVMAGLIPIFLLEYAGVDPRTIRNVDFMARRRGPAVSPLAVLPPGVRPPDLGRVSMIATVPLLTNGIASYFLVPLSIAIGRRPIMLLAATCAWIGGMWAATSSSLTSHLGARALQGLGAGAVEALIPLVVSDLFFIHQRNKWMSLVITSQGLVIISLGIAAPYIAANYSWRYVYWITSGMGIIAWILLIFYLPETRWKRSKAELSGKAVWPLEEGQDRPRIDHLNYSPRSWWTDIGMFNCGYEWREAGISMLNTLRTTFFPSVLWATLANSIMVVAQQSTQQIGPFALLAQGWSFQYTGFAVLPFFFAAMVVYAVGGPLADRVVLAMTRRKSGGGSFFRRKQKKCTVCKNCMGKNGDPKNTAECLDGAREAEYHLVNFILPFATAIIGIFLFGASAQQGLHWAVLLTAMFLVIFGFLTVMTLVNVYTVETYPMWAGPVLVNVSSMRIIIGFFLASETTTWVMKSGPFKVFAAFGEVMIVVSLGIPLLFFFGKRIRVWTAGRVKVADKEDAPIVISGPLM